MNTFPISIGRVYDPMDQALGARLLIDRLWPRGIRKNSLRLDAWLKHATPSQALRQWFHDARESRYGEFCDRYRQELTANPIAVADCLQWCRRGPVLLLTAASTPETSHAPVLRQLLLERLQIEARP